MHNSHLCPTCKKEMQIKTQDTTHDGKGKNYTRTIFHCKPDDIWITIESPE